MTKFQTFNYKLLLIINIIMVQTQITFIVGLYLQLSINIFLLTDTAIVGNPFRAKLVIY